MERGVLTLSDYFYEYDYQRRNTFNNKNYLLNYLLNYLFNYSLRLLHLRVPIRNRSHRKSLP